MRLFILPPHSLELKGCVERAHCTHQEEFYEVHLEDLQPGHLDRALRAWERVYSAIRSHHSLDGLIH